MIGCNVTIRQRQDFSGYDPLGHTCDQNCFDRPINVYYQRDRSMFIGKPYAQPYHLGDPQELFLFEFGFDRQQGIIPNGTNTKVDDNATGIGTYGYIKNNSNAYALDMPNKRGIRVFSHPGLRQIAAYDDEYVFLTIDAPGMSRSIYLCR